MDLGQTNALHNHILNFSSNIHHIYSSLLKLKTIFQVSSVERRLGLSLLFSRMFLPVDACSSWAETEVAVCNGDTKDVVKKKIAL